MKKINLPLREPIIVLLLVMFPVISGLQLWGQPTTPGTTVGMPRAAPVAETKQNIPGTSNMPYLPGDAVRISIFPDSAKLLSGDYPIDDQGYIDLPKAGLVYISKLSKEEFIGFLKETFVDYLRYPNIQVRPLIRVGMVGGFNQPGLFLVDPRNNLWELISHAGGAKREDGLSLISWERNGTVVSKTLIKQIESGISLSAMGVQSGDQFRVTERPRKEGWDIFKEDVLPVLSFAITAVATTFTVFLAIQALEK